MSCSLVGDTLGSSGNELVGFPKHVQVVRKTCATCAKLFLAVLGCEFSDVSATLHSRNLSCVHVQRLFLCRSLTVLLIDILVTIAGANVGVCK